MQIRKAVITAAGWGTRFLPITKAQPKEMLPLGTKPLIQYAVEEAINSGIEQIVVITALGKRAIEDYFDRSFELEYFLEKKGEIGFLEEIRKLSTLVDVCYIRQKEQLGLGHAILTARHFIGNEPFAVLLPDDIIDSKPPLLKHMVDVYEQYESSVVAVQRIAKKDAPKYGIIDPRTISDHIHEVLSLTEKPEPAQALSNLGIVGRYILTPEIFNVMQVTQPGKNKEIQLTDALQLLLKQQAIYAYEFSEERYDAGTPIGWLKAVLSFGLRNPTYGQELREYLDKSCK
ncbi:MAG: UTP--glucose-1-phosphate uridylyltransferase GalU [Dehalococcoidales bacterium]|nr:UTP--glucose-1-phosphate uridylyltransferase GalU [Dehalococcoidales bacterium]